MYWLRCSLASRSVPILPGPTIAARVFVLTPSNLPQTLCREGGELGPHHGRVHLGGEAGPGGESAVGAGDDVLPADQAGVGADGVGDQLGGLDVVGGVAEQPG